MNRRSFITGMGASLALASLPLKSLANQDDKFWANRHDHRVSNQWEADPAYLDGMYIVRTILSTYSDAREAVGYWVTFQGLADERGNEFLGFDKGLDGKQWQAFFVEYVNPYTIVNEGFGQAGNVVVQLRWESNHFGGERDGYALFRNIMNSIGGEIRTEEELAALLPTSEDVNAFQDREKYHLREVEPAN